jgi:peptidoglycan-associated lipoprotein
MENQNVTHAKTYALLTLLVALAACSSTPTAPTAAPAAPAPSPAPTPAPMPEAMPKPMASSEMMAKPLPAYLDPKSPIYTGRSVYFDFDDFKIKKEFDGLVELQGKYLSSNPDLSVKIEGNADERGSAEYNLALGQKRAEAMVKALEIYGAKGSQMEPISWGKEKPKALGHDEAAWAQNRRADIVYPSK